MNIRQCRGNSVLAKPSFPDIVPVSQVLFLAVGVFVPAPDRCGLRPTEGQLSYAHCRAPPRRHRYCRGRL